MAKTTYPVTTLPPLQSLYFMLSDGSQVHALLKPQPDASGAKVSHADMDCAGAGSDLLMGFSSTSETWTIIQAALEAYRYAVHEANRINATIIEIRLGGEEFVERADIAQIAGPSVPIVIV